MERGSGIRGRSMLARAAAVLCLALAASLVPVASVAAAPYRFQVSPSEPTGGWVAGSTYGVSVFVRNTSTGLTDPSYRGTVRVTSTDPRATLPPDHTFTAADAGFWSFTLTLAAAGNIDLTLTDVADSGITGSATIVVVPGPAAGLDFVRDPGDGAPGVPFASQPIVWIVDAHGNHVYGYPATDISLQAEPESGTIGHLTCTGGTVQSTGATGFAAEFGGCAIDAPGRFHLSAKAPAGSGLADAASASFTLARPAVALSMYGLPASVAVGEVAGTLLYAVDSADFAVSGYRGTVHFTSTDPTATLPADYTFTAADAGSHPFELRFGTAGSQSVTVADVANPALRQTKSVAVTSAPIPRFTWSLVPATATVGTATSALLWAEDAVGLTDAAYRGTVHFTSSDPAAVLPPDYTFTAADAGVHSVGFTFGTAGTWTVSATQVGSSTRMGTTSGIVVTGGSTPPTTPPGPSSAIAVTVASRVVTFPGPVVASVVLAGGAGRTVALQRRTVGTSTWAEVASVVLGPDASGSASVSQEKNAEYRAVWAGASYLPAATSAPVMVTVRYRVVVTPAATTRTVRAGTTASWTATVRPASNPTSVRFRVYRRVGSRWVLSSTTVVRTSADGRAILRKRFATAGRFYLEATALGNTVNAGGTATKKYLTVR